MPNRGTLVGGGSAIAGEAGREGILPQQSANAQRLYASGCVQGDYLCNRADWRDRAGHSGDRRAGNARLE